MAGWCVETSKVEQNIRLHRGEEGEPRGAGRLVQEVSPRDLTVATFAGCFAHDQVDDVHFAHDVLESAHRRVGDLATVGDIAQTGQVFQDVVGQLVSGCLEDDALKLMGLNVSITINVHGMKCLPNALSLQSPQHLSELRVGHLMTALAAARVQGSPCGIPVERNILLGIRLTEQAFHIFPLDGTCSLNIEQAEGYLVLGIGLSEEVLERCPVGKGQSPGLSRIGNLEEDGVLFPLDLVLHGELTSVLAKWLGQWRG